MKLSTPSIVLGACMLLAPSAFAQSPAFATTVPGAWIDISTSPTATEFILSNNQERNFTTTIGNNLLSPGVVRVGSNGGIRWSAGGPNLLATNGPISSTPPSNAFNGAQALLPFWDNLNSASGTQGNIYWEEVGGTLIVQWQDVQFAGTSGDTVSFQVQVFGGTSNVYAQFIYDDVMSTRANGGASATIGYQAGGVATDNQFSFNSVAVVDGDVLSLVSAPDIGTSYCSANANSTGVPSVIGAYGSTVAASDSVVLETSSLPANKVSYYLVSVNQGFITNPNGSQGNLCLGSGIGRFNDAGQIQNSGPYGVATFALPLTALAQPGGGTIAVMAGDTWNFQCWHRDNVSGTSTSNFSDAVSITFN